MPGRRQKVTDKEVFAAAQREGLSLRGRAIQPDGLVHEPGHQHSQMARGRVFGEWQWVTAPYHPTQVDHECL